jgi:hypothetical protein
MLSPDADMGSMEGVDFRNHTRWAKRKSLSSRAPTGHRSMTLAESSLSRGLPGKISISFLLPRPRIMSSPVPETSRVKRTQREHMMQRSE